MKMLKKVGAVLLAAALSLPQFLSFDVKAAEPKGLIRAEVELYAVYTSSETWVCPESGWYRIWCVGASGKGGSGASGQFTSNERTCRSGSGGNSGAIAISDLYFKKGTQVPMTISGIASFGGYMSAEAGADGTNGVRSDSAPSTKAPTAIAHAYGGNVLNAYGFKGGDEGVRGGNDGGLVSSAGGGGARYADTKYTVPADELTTSNYIYGGRQAYNGSSSEKAGGSYKPWSFSNAHHSGDLYLTGAGGGGACGYDSGMSPDPNHSSGSGGQGQPALIIMEKAVVPTEPDIAVIPEKSWLNLLDGNADVILSSDELDSFENAKLLYSFDNINWTEYSAPFAVDRTTTVYSKITFADGESETAQKEIHIDSLPPSIVSAVVDESDMENRFLTVTAEDTGGSGVKGIWIDNVMWTDNPAVYYIPDGKETVTLKVEDIAGNLSEPVEQVVRHIDTIPPTIDSVEFTDDLSVMTVRMSDDTYGDGVKGAYINGVFKAGNPVLWAVPENAVILRLQAEDNNGNKSEIRRERVPGRTAIVDAITIDSITFSEDNTMATVTASTSEPGTSITGIYCNDELVVGNPVTYTIPVDNSQYLKVQAVNNEGDKSEIVTKRVPGWSEVTDSIAVTSVELLNENKLARVRADTTRLNATIMGIYVNSVFYEGNPIECAVASGTEFLECQAVDNTGDLSQPVIRPIPKGTTTGSGSGGHHGSSGGSSSTTSISISEPVPQDEGQYRVDISAKDSECKIEKIVAVWDGHKEDITKSHFILLENDTLLQVIAVNSDGRMTYKKVRIQLASDEQIIEEPVPEIPAVAKTNPTAKHESYAGQAAPIKGNSVDSGSDSTADPREQLEGLLRRQQLKHKEQPAQAANIQQVLPETIRRSSGSPNRPGAAAVLASVLCFLTLMVLISLLVRRQHKQSAYCTPDVPKKI